MKIFNKKIYYEFDDKLEYKYYKKIGKSKLSNFCKWENYIRDKYLKIEAIDYFINFAKYLNAKYKGYKFRKEIICSISFPIIILMFSLFSLLPSFMINDYEQYSISVSKYNELKLEINKKTEQEVLDDKIINFTEEFENLKKTIKRRDTIIYIYIVYVIIIGGILTVLIAYFFTRISFYEDYKCIIERIIEDKKRNHKARSVYRKSNIEK